MNYEKMYKEALKKAKDGKPIEEIFPELTTNERIIKEIRGFLCWANERGSITNYQFKSWISWLEKQGEQKPIEPNWVHHKVDLSDCSEEYCKAYYDGWNNCNQQHAQLEAEQNPAWNEEDEQMLQDIISGLKSVEHIIFTHDSQGKTQIQSRINWLKSLRPQNRWKPSDKQMTILEAVVKYTSQISAYWSETLQSLYNDLKKL